MSISHPLARLRHLRRLADDAGQGTVEYVGLLLLMASVLAGIVAVSSQLGGKDQIGTKVVKQIGAQIDRVGDAKTGK
jgi:hypothetical protein